ncbi:MAG: polysaccharide pyruvyl transferase CsaB [Bacillota bacterium]|jgi:polysaccharide pyruvyl transferase CsaB
MTSKIVISGYYGFQNVGDEGVLYSMIRTLRAEHPDLSITVLSKDPEKTAEAYGVKAANRWKLREIVRAVKECDLFISGGGSLLQDVTGPRSILYYLGVVYLAKLLRKKLFFYAQGVGPVTGALGKWLIKKVVNGVDLVTVRDEASRDLLLQLGVQKPRIIVTADPVLGLYAREMDRGPGIKVLANNGVPLGEGAPPLVGISVRSWRNYQGYKKVLAALGDYLARKGYQVVFFPFHFPADVACCREVAKLMEAPSTVIRDRMDVVEMLGALGELHLLVGMRLHALIMAFVMGVPLVGISYDPKVDSFLKDAGLPLAGRVETLDFGVLEKEVDKVLWDREGIKGRMEEAAAEMRSRARETGRLAVELLKR